MKLLFVCTGNICRSPTAEGVMAQLLAAEGLSDEVIVDSAGTGSWHVGDPVDSRAREAAARRGLALNSVARQVRPHDLDDFDLVLAADRANEAELLTVAGSDPERRDKVRLLREYDPRAVEEGDLEVPDPYYGEGDGFERVLDICEAACVGLLEALEESGQV
jgi:protein-tyrosine phosphatase